MLHERDEAAGQMASAAQATRSDPWSSPLVRAIIRHTADMLNSTALPVMLWDGDPEMLGLPPASWHYDGYAEPEPEIWLALDDYAQLDAIVAWYQGPRRPKVLVQDERVDEYAVMQAILETELCLDDPPTLRAALTRLRQEGLDRPQAMFALHSFVSTNIEEGRSQERYAQDIAAVARGGRSEIDRVLARVRRRGKAAKRTRNAKKVGGSKKRRSKGSRKRR